MNTNQEHLMNYCICWQQLIFYITKFMGFDFIANDHEGNWENQQM